MKTKYQILIIILLAIIFIAMCFLYIKSSSSNTNLSTIEWYDFMQGEENTSSGASTTSSVINTTTSIDSALTENIELHATYYLEECLVEEYQQVKEGENIIKYTNGMYLTAPYDCIINSISVPNVEDQCKNSHYIEISSSKLLTAKISVDETLINSLSVGDEAKIEIIAYKDKAITGYITKISNTASNGKFTVTVEFENDGDIKIGMTANISIETEEFGN